MSGWIPVVHRKILFSAATALTPNLLGVLFFSSSLSHTVLLLARMIGLSVTSWAATHFLSLSSPPLPFFHLFQLYSPAHSSKRIWITKILAYARISQRQKDNSPWNHEQESIGIRTSTGTNILSSHHQHQQTSNQHSGLPNITRIATATTTKALCPLCAKPFAVLSSTLTITTTTTQRSGSTIFHKGLRP